MNAKKLIGDAHRGIYRASGGKIGGRFGKAPVLLLTTTGRKTGRQRTMPLLYVSAGNGYAVVASAGGQPQHPSWYVNLLANPAVTVEIGKETRQLRAREATGDERTALWTSLTAMYPAYDSYQAKTSRQIPVVVLEP